MDNNNPFLQPQQQPQQHAGHVPGNPFAMPKPPNQRRQGKGAKQRNQDKFRERTGDQITSALRASLRAKYGLDDESRSVFEVAERASVVVTKTAKEMPVTTRGVGINATLAFSAIERILGRDEVASMCNIHQFYRCMLYAVQYKLVLAHRSQHERVAGGSAFRAIPSDRALEDEMSQLGKIPAVLAMLVNSIGRVETQQGVYHAGLPDIGSLPLNAAASLLTIDVLRNFLVALAGAPDPALLAVNAIPGLLITAQGVPENVDDVVGVNPDIHADTQAVRALMARASAKMPPSFFSEVEWTGRGRSNLLWSLPLSNMRLVGTRGAALRPNSNRRNAQGQPVQQPPAVNAPVQTVVNGNEYVDMWCFENTLEREEAYFASALLIGEDVFAATRFASVSSCMVNLNPRLAMDAMIITDRKA